MYTIRDCIADPLINIEPSKIDNDYYCELRKFIDINFYEFIKDFSLINKKIVDIGITGHIKHIDNVIIETIDIDKNNNPTYICDITKNNSHIIESEKYDIAICTEVLEHVYNPLNAIEEVARITKKNGIIIFSTPYNFRIHGPLYDTFRFSEWFYKNYFKNNYTILKLVALEDISRTLFPISYFCIIKKNL
jgi:SAM-dependent methyltransferase